MDDDRWNDRVLIELAKGNKKLEEATSEIRKFRSIFITLFIVVPLLVAAAAIALRHFG